MFRQRLVHRERGCTITLMERTPLAAPVRVAGRPILEPDAPVVWFTFEGAWHDIGRFHTARGEFTGFYANILTPVRFLSPLEWETTDLCLDVWHSADGTLLLDEDEFDAAAASGWLAPETASAARREAERLLRLAQRGEWPPAVVHEWPLARAAQLLAGGTPHDDVV